jgi:hypothetical protein
MPLIILLIIALVLGYWLARSKFHEPIEKAAQQPIKWWNRLVHRSEGGGPNVEETDREKENYGQG